MPLRLTVFFGLMWLVAAKAGEPIDGRTAGKWIAHPEWAPGKASSSYSVGDSDGVLAFVCSGGVMTWTFDPAAVHLAGGKRYLLLRYRAEGVVSTGDYLLLARDGSPDWRHYLTQRDLIPDGAEHTLAVDLLSFLPPGNLEQFAVRISSAPGQTARLVARLEFANELPDGTRAAGAPAGDRKTARMDL